MDSFRSKKNTTEVILKSRFQISNLLAQSFIKLGDISIKLFDCCYPLKQWITFQVDFQNIFFVLQHIYKLAYKLKLVSFKIDVNHGS